MQAPDWFVTNVMGPLMASYPSWPCSTATIQAFWNVLNTLPRQNLERAAIEHCANEKAWPVPASVRVLALANDAKTMTPSEAWDEMYSHRHAHTKNPKWSSEAVARAAQAVNWNEPNWLTEQLPTIRAQFERYYTAVAKRTERITQHNDALDLLARSVSKDAKELYGAAYLKGEPADIEYERSRLEYQKRDDADPPQIDDIDD